MRQLTRIEPGRLAWTEVDAPRLQAPGEALVRPLAVTLCDIDRPMIEGRFPVPGEIGMGHELVAEVVEIGEKVSSFAKGDTVVVPFQISCGSCAHCRRGLTAHCESVAPRSQYGFGAYGGDCGAAFSDLLRVPFADAMLLAVPPGVRPEAIAAASDNLGDGWRAVAPALRERPGAEVLILGGIGSVPLYAADIARACGAGKVDYLDTDRKRLAVAEALGANALEGPIPQSVGDYDLTIDATLFEPEGLACALRSLRPGGLCVGVTIYLQDPHIPYFSMYSRGTRLVTGRVNARAAMPEVLALVRDGHIHPERVSECILPFDTALEGCLDTTLKPVFTRT